MFLSLCYVLLLDSLVIGHGAFGHALQVRHLHAAIDQFPIEPDMHSMIYVVWYFVGGGMLPFGVTLMWVCGAFERKIAGRCSPPPD